MAPAGERGKGGRLRGDGADAGPPPPAQGGSASRYPSGAAGGATAGDKAAVDGGDGLGTIVQTCAYAARPPEIDSVLLLTAS